jgi:hypothetical protein
VTAEPWLTKRELARELRVSPRTITRLAPPCMPVGGQNRYRLSEVLDALRGSNVVSLAEQHDRKDAAA